MDGLTIGRLAREGRVNIETAGTTSDADGKAASSHLWNIAERAVVGMGDLMAEPRRSP